MPPKRDRPTGGTPPTKKTKDKDSAASESNTICISCDDHQAQPTTINVYL